MDLDENDLLSYWEFAEYVCSSFPDQSPCMTDWEYAEGCYVEDVFWSPELRDRDLNGDGVIDIVEYQCMWCEIQEYVNTTTEFDNAIPCDEV